MQSRYLIVGLGNPGQSYENTRHNIGFRILKTFAAKYGISFRPSIMRAKGNLAQGEILGKKVFLLLPLTYMNESGLSVRKCIDYYKIDRAASHLIVVSDDIALPFGCLRFRQKGSSGGHRGLESIQAHLQTSQYARLRIGVGDRERGELADYVLGEFSREEERELPNVVDNSIGILETWLEEGIESAMSKVTILGEK